MASFGANMPPTLKPVTEIECRATEIIGQMQCDRVPVLIAEHGKEAAIMLDVGTYNEMLQRLELLDIISKGECAFVEGRSSPCGEVKDRLSSRGHDQWLWVSVGRCQPSRALTPFCHA
jgi:PHD/YefM family antitoxin component YafN of YafNO toxin-antitoxin module